METTTGHEPVGRQGWPEVAHAHADRVYRLARRLTGNRQDAEDLTQEVLERVLRARGEVPHSVEGWLHRVTTNLFLDQARRRRRLRFDVLSAARAERLSDDPGPEQGYAERTLDDDVEAALATLRPDLRAAVVLCDVEGLGYAEIADVLGVRVGTVRSRIHRGRARLRAALSHRAPTAGRSRYAGALTTAR